MRKNYNKDKSADSFRKLIRVTGILAAAVVIGVGVMFLCSSLIQNDYRSQVSEIQQQNTQRQAEFEEQMTALRNANRVQTTLSDDDGEEKALDRFERTLLETNWTVEDQGKIGLDNFTTVSYERLALINGGLLLVNQWHSLPADFAADDVVSVGRTSGGAIQVDNYGLSLFPAAYDALLKTITAAKDEANIQYYIVREAYRSNEEQTRMFEAAKEKISDKYTGDVLIEQAKKEVNYPGTSDYQTGMTARIVAYNKDDPNVAKGAFSTSPQGVWLAANCWRFGIIPRFPVDGFPSSDYEDKSYKTGISTKLNMYRFVGVPHATAMRVMDFCLEEYVEYLIEHPHLCVYENGHLKYEIFRLAAEELSTYNLPKPNMASDYIASFDNMGGIVMGYTYE